MQKNIFCLGNINFNYYEYGCFVEFKLSYFVLKYVTTVEKPPHTIVPNL